MVPAKKCKMVERKKESLSERSGEFRMWYLPRRATQLGIKPASDATAGSASIPAPTVVPATNEMELMS